MIEISVSEPVTQGEGMNAYISYRVETRTDLPQFEQQEFYQIRRYSDFLWLQNELEYHYPGIIIPPLPEKTLIGRFSKPFIDSRRRALEKFLKRVATHPVLSTSQKFREFLEFSEELFTKVKEDAKHEKKKQTKGFWQWATEASQSLSSKLGSAAADASKVAKAVSGSFDEETQSSATHHQHQQQQQQHDESLNKDALSRERESDRETSSLSSFREAASERSDERFEDARSYINGFAPQMANVYKHTSTLVEKNKEMSKGLFDFGLAVSLLSQSESDSLSVALSTVGDCADHLSVMATNHADSESVMFEEPIRDYMRLTDAVKHAIAARDERKHQYDSCMADLSRKIDTHERLSIQPGKEDKAAIAQQEVTAAKRSAEAAARDLETVQERVLQEVERFKQEKLQDFKAMLLDFAQLQIEYNKKVEEAWQEVLPQLHAVHAPEPNNELLNAYGISSASSSTSYSSSSYPESGQRSSKAEPTSTSNTIDKRNINSSSPSSPSSSSSHSFSRGFSQDSSQGFSTTSPQGAVETSGSEKADMSKQKQKGAKSKKKRNDKDIEKKNQGQSQGGVKRDFDASAEELRASQDDNTASATEENLLDLTDKIEESHGDDGALFEDSHNPHADTTMEANSNTADKRKHEPSTHTQHHHEEQSLGNEGLHDGHGSEEIAAKDVTLEEDKDENEGESESGDEGENVQVAAAVAVEQGEDDSDGDPV